MYPSLWFVIYLKDETDKLFSAQARRQDQSREPVLAFAVHLCIVSIVGKFENNQYRFFCESYMLLLFTYV